jgi:hypothetical protein
VGNSAEHEVEALEDRRQAGGREGPELLDQAAGSIENAIFDAAGIGLHLHR